MPLKGRVTFVQGEAKARLAGQGDWVLLNKGDRIPPKSDLKTGPESALEVKYFDGSVFFLRSDTEVGILQARKTKTSHLLHDFLLSTGRLISYVKTATGKVNRYKIHTPTAIASVRGTGFRVAVDKEQSTFVEVTERRVLVDGANKRIELAQREGTLVRKDAPPLPPQKLLPPPAPVELKPVYNTEPVIAFTRFDNAKNYRVMVAKDRAGKHLLREKIIRPEETYTIAGLADGAYFLLSQSIDPIGLEGLPSDAYPFTIRANPLPPIISSPRDGSIFREKKAALGWLSVSDAVRYHIQVAEDKEFHKIVLDKTDLNDSTFNAGGLEYGTYYFRIRSVAKDGYMGTWSDTLSFILAPPPPTPTVEQPVVSGKEILLRSKSVGKDFSYHFQISRDVQFNKILIDQRSNIPEITIPKPKDSGIYFVRTAAIDVNGDAGEFSSPQSFEIKRFPYEWIGGGGLILLLLLAVQ
jgi:hypothetical protein